MTKLIMIGNLNNLENTYVCPFKNQQEFNAWEKINLEHIRQMCQAEAESMEKSFEPRSIRLTHSSGTKKVLIVPNLDQMDEIYIECQNKPEDNLSVYYQVQSAVIHGQEVFLVYIEFPILLEMKTTSTCSVFETKFFEFLEEFGVWFYYINYIKRQ